MNWHADRNDFSDIWPLAVDASGTGIWDRNVATGEIRYSGNWFRMLGYDAVPQSNLIEVAYTRVHPDDLAYVQASLQDHFEGRTTSYEVEHRLRCKDGSYKWVVSRGKVISRDADGNALRMIGTTTDIPNSRPPSAEKRDKSARFSLPAAQRRRTMPKRRKLSAPEESPAFPQRRTHSIPCFVRGTTILTPRGPVAVEALAVGNAVLTIRENGPSERRVVWVGQRSFGTKSALLPTHLCPVLIRADAFGPGAPERDLRLSPDHAVFVENHLIEAQHLINGLTVLRDTACHSVTYYHVALDAHDILLAENLPVESYLDCGNPASFSDFTTANGVPILLRPDTAKTVEAFGCARLAEPGSKALLKARALLDEYASLADSAPRRSHQDTEVLRLTDRDPSRIK